jgi:hypothetical protein
MVDPRPKRRLDRGMNDNEKILAKLKQIHVAVFCIFGVLMMEFVGCTPNWSIPFSASESEEEIQEEPPAPSLWR